jgi:glycosyltransferase involved in cell wall biosynthesis
MSLQQIHPVLITRDAAGTIERALASLREFPSVIVYDNGSTDATLEICGDFDNVETVTGSFMGFGRTKAHAVTLARGDWVLSIDADEYLSETLVESLRAANLDDPRVAYAVLRQNLFLGKHVRHGGWGNDWLVRLFNRTVCQFDDSAVHEKVALSSNVRVARLAGPLWHQAVRDIDQFLTKISRYSELSVYRSSRTHNPFMTCVHAAWAFFRSYVLQAGFLDGWRGLVIATCDAMGCFFKHMKRYVHYRALPVDDRRRKREIGAPDSQELQRQTRHDGERLH